MRSGPVVRGPGRLRHGNGLGSSNPLPISRLSSRGLGPERQRRGRRDAEPRCAHPSPPCSPHRQAASRSGRRQTYFLLALERCPCSPCGGVAFEISGRLRCRWLMSLRGKVRGQPVRARIPIQGWAYSSVRVVNGRDQNRLVCEFFFHLALLLSKGSGWRNHAFYHVESAKKEDNCAPRGKHASAPHRPAVPLPAIRLASASHARSSVCPPLARSMHALLRAHACLSQVALVAAAAAKRSQGILPKCGISRHQHVCRCGKPIGTTHKFTDDLRLP